MIPVRSKYSLERRGEGVSLRHKYWVWFTMKGIKKIFIRSFFRANHPLAVGQKTRELKSKIEYI
jgi:hypothetical protein